MSINVHIYEDKCEFMVINVHIYPDKCAHLLKCTFTIRLLFDRGLYVNYVTNQINQLQAALRQANITIESQNQQIQAMYGYKGPPVRK